MSMKVPNLPSNASLSSGSVSATDQANASSFDETWRSSRVPASYSWNGMSSAWSA